MLPLTRLHPLYQSATEEEAILIANLGALCWQSCKKELYKHWETSEDSAKAEGWREEGRQAMMEVLKGKLEEGTRANVRLIESELQLKSIQEKFQTELSRQITEQVEKQRLILELERVSPLQQRLSVLESKDDMIILLKQQSELLQTRLEGKEKDIQTLQASLDQSNVKNTKSSHAIGKAGEATVLEMLEEHVLPTFQFSRVEDKTAIDHAADFHVWMMASPSKTIKILIDAKKYKANVKMSEILKLHSDVDADPEASVGIMVSLDSGMSTFKQFEIGKTEKNKMIMYISLENMEYEQRVSCLIWALRALSSIAGVQDLEKQRSMIENIEVFANEIDKSVKEMDGIIRSCQKTTEMMRTSRDRLYSRLEKYREGGDLSIEGDKIEHIEGDFNGIFCKGVKPNGTPCKKRAQSGKEFCSFHAPAEIMT